MLLGTYGEHCIHLSADFWKTYTKPEDNINRFIQPGRLLLESRFSCSRSFSSRAHHDGADRNPRRQTLAVLLLQPDRSSRCATALISSSSLLTLTHSPDFLRISRSAVDDTISQNLNALLSPSLDGFDPISTSQRLPRPTGKRPIPAAACDSFKQKVLFPSWQARSDVLAYCGGVATSPDPDDPDHVLREVEDAKARERVINERLDPYSGRYFPREVRTEALASLVRNERMVESIVRNRTWGMIRERCSDHEFDGEKAFDKWRQEQKEA